MEIITINNVKSESYVTFKIKNYILDDNEKEIIINYYGKINGLLIINLILYQQLSNEILIKHFDIFQVFYYDIIFNQTINNNVKILYLDGAKEMLDLDDMKLLMFYFNKRINLNILIKYKNILLREIKSDIKSYIESLESFENLCKEKNLLHILEKMLLLWKRI